MAAIWGSIISGIIGAIGQDQMQGQIGNAGRRIRQSTQFNPQSVYGPFGHFRPDGNRMFRMEEDAFNTDIRNVLGMLNPQLMAGGSFNTRTMQDALEANDIMNPFLDAQAGLGQQMGGSMFGNMGIMQNAMLQAGQSALGNTDQNALVQQYIDAQRGLAQPFQDRQFNRLQDRLFAQGRLDSSGGSRQMTDLLGEFTRLDNQNVLAGQQLGLQAMQQNRGFGMDAMRAASGMEGQAFGQALQALQQNQSAGQTRLQNAMGLFGFGDETFARNFGLGMQGSQNMLNRDQFLLNSVLGLLNAESGRIGAMGMNNQALGNLYGAGAASTGGFFSGLAGSFGGLFG